MKQNKTLRRNLIYLFSLGGLLLSGIATFSSFLLQDKIEVSAAVGNYQTDPLTYYTSVENKTRNDLLFGLHDLMISTHRTYTSYADLGANNYQTYTDRDPNNSNNILAWYSRASIPRLWDSGHTYNREHVWPQSNSNGLFGTTGAGSDMHHIRPVIPDINSRRGNSKFGYVGASYNIASYGLGNLESKYTSSIFEPHDEVKGDAARIIMYLYVHYNSSKALGNGNAVENYTTTLPIRNVMQGSSNQDAFDLLLEWHELDPVDHLEIARNNQVAIYQGNRNPFIDRPEFACYIWGSLAAPTSLSISPSTNNIAVDEEKLLTVNASPSNANTSVTWATSNANVVTVNNGVIKGVNAGTATITATSTLNPSVKATASVNVTYTSVTGVTLPQTITMNVSETRTIIPTIIPSNASNKNVSWTSSDTSVATIHATNGLITAKKIGTSTITVTTQDGNKVATSALTVQGVTGGEVIYTITSKSTVTTSGIAPPGSSATYSQTFDTPGQYTANAPNAFLTLKNYYGFKITKIILSMKSNTARGAGKLDYSVNGGSSYVSLIPDSSFSSHYWHGDWSTQFVDIERTVSIVATNDNLVFKITASENSLYCESFTIQYEKHESIATLTSLEIISPPHKMNYFEGEYFDYNGLEVLAHYSDGYAKDVTEDVEVTPNKLTYGTTFVTISYTDKGVTKSIILQNIVVTKLVLSSISVHTSPHETTFPLGSEANFSGLTLLATYSNNHQEIINEHFSVSVNTSLLGEQEAIVTYFDKVTTFEVFITNLDAEVGVHVTTFEQALAYAQYFLDITHPICLAMSGNFEPYWSTLKNEFNYLVDDSKDEIFYNDNDHQVLFDATERYLFIVNKYQNLDDYLANSNNELLSQNYIAGSLNSSYQNIIEPFVLIMVAILLPFVIYLIFRNKKKINF